MEVGPGLAALKLFARTLEARSGLQAAEREGLLALPGQLQRVRAHEEFVQLGEPVQYSCLIVSGMVARFAQLEDGRRQIISLHIPGDMVDLYSLMLPRAPSPLQALTTAEVLRVPHAALRKLVFDHPGLSAAFWRDCVAGGSIVAQWLVSVGRRNARGRMAHLLCEMALRYAWIGMLQGNRFALPMTQEQIADALGLTPVHVNRSIKGLREEGLAQMQRGQVTVLDWASLADAAEFDPAYLHLPDPEFVQAGSSAGK